MGTHEDPNETPEQPAPDPGNSPPETWTEEMTADEIDEVTKRLLDDADEDPPTAPTGNDFSALKED